MLTAPNAEGRPLFAAKDINSFYLEHCPKIFPSRDQVTITRLARKVKTEPQRIYVSICARNEFVTVIRGGIHEGQLDFPPGI